MIDLSMVRFTKRVCNDVTLHVAESGPENGPLVILLHGFPEFWFGWREQIAALAGAGYHLVIPDQRGYNLSDKPKGIENYDVDKLSDDVLALAAHYTNEPFRLVGHDWGALAAWWTATRHPEKLRSLCVLNCPHPAIWTDAMKNDPVQRRAAGMYAYLRFRGCRSFFCATAIFADWSARSGERTARYLTKTWRYTARRGRSPAR